MKPDKILKELKKWLKEGQSEQELQEQQSVKDTNYCMAEYHHNQAWKCGDVLRKIKELEDE